MNQSTACKTTLLSSCSCELYGQASGEQARAYIDAFVAREHQLALENIQ